MRKPLSRVSTINRLIAAASWRLVPRSKWRNNSQSRNCVSEVICLSVLFTGGSTLGGGHLHPYLGVVFTGAEKSPLTREEEAGFSAVGITVRPQTQVTAPSREFPRFFAIGGSSKLCTEQKGSCSGTIPKRTWRLKKGLQETRKLLLTAYGGLGRGGVVSRVPQKMNFGLRPRFR